jgi:hypothetical protein
MGQPSGGKRLLKNNELFIKPYFSIFYYKHALPDVDKMTGPS